MGLGESRTVTSQRFVETLRTVVGALQLPPTDPLRQDIEGLDGGRASDRLQVAVFGPFNYGKSTLLNAILGQRALPIDLIPTTGAAIRVRYGDALQTRIQLTDGRDLVESGTDSLKQFAILDDDRRMRSDVRAIEVVCPHPLLKLGVELIDLPGTNDREAQDDLVKTELLKADLVIQVLDGRKLMTLGERENLRDWLLDRGITTVIFVVNFLNLLEPEEQRHIYHRLRFVAESFRADLPDGVSNLYRVDALPALRARLKGDAAADQTTGLSTFEAALQTIALQFNQQSEGQSRSQQSRLTIIADQVQQQLRQSVQTLESEQAEQLTASQAKAKQKRQIQQKAQALLQSAIEADLFKLRQWLSLDNLLADYQLESAVALQSQAFDQWEQSIFKAKAIERIQSLGQWVQQVSTMFEKPLPEAPEFIFPAIPEEIAARIAPPNASPAPTKTTAGNAIPVATVATGMGWIFGGPVGAAVLGSTSYALNRLSHRIDADEARASSQVDRAALCQTVAAEYLRHFSNLNLAILEQYASLMPALLSLPAEIIVPTNIEPSDQLRLLRSLLTQLEDAIAEYSPST
jgi:hypothetical protein